MSELVRYAVVDGVATLAMDDGKANSTNLRIGVDQGARIQINEVKIGLTLPRFATEVCRQRLSPAHFSRAVLTAEPYSGQQAVVAGFLDEVCPSESLALTAVERAKALSTLHLESFRATKLRLRGATLDALRVAIDGDVAEWHKRFLPDRG